LFRPRLGAVAQLVERFNGIEEVRSSILLSSIRRPRLNARPLLFPLLSVFWIGCGHGSIPSAAPSPIESPEAGDEPVPPDRGGTIVTGRITLHGNPPPPQSRAVALDAAICGAGPKLDRSLLV